MLSASCNALEIVILWEMPLLTVLSLLGLLILWLQIYFSLLFTSFNWNILFAFSIYKAVLKSKGSIGEVNQIAQVCSISEVNQTPGPESFCSFTFAC